MGKDASGDCVGVGHGVVGNGVASVDMGSSIGENRFDCCNLGRGGDNRGNCGKMIGNRGCDNGRANGVDKSVLVVIFRESLKSNVLVSPIGGCPSTKSWMKRSGSSPGGQICIQWAALANSEEGRQANENFHDDVVVKKLQNYWPMRPIECIFDLRGCCRTSSSSFWCLDSHQ
jgi:hypothetical protein